MRVFIAAYDLKLAKQAKLDLLKAGHTVTSTWHDLTFRRTSESTSEACRAKGDNNVVEVLRSECVLVFVPRDLCPGGIYVEVGAAIGIGLPVFSVGYRPGGLRGNFIMYHSLVSQYATIEDAVQAMEEK